MDAQLMSLTATFVDKGETNATKNLPLAMMLGLRQYIIIKYIAMPFA